MTEKQIEVINKAQLFVYVELPRKHEAELKCASEQLTRLEAKCDHTYPDGKTAWEDGFLCNVCKICRENDF